MTTLERTTINALTALHNSKRPLLTCYLPVADPAALDNQAAIYVDCGVDIIELGVPCEKPFMDGAVVAASMQRIIQAGVSQAMIGSEISALRDTYKNLSIVVMGYDNMHLKELLEQGEAKFDGLLRIGDIEETKRLVSHQINNADEVDIIQFIPYEMSEDDVARACSAKGYIMLQAAAGKTGIRDSLDQSSAEKIEVLKEAGVDIPILLGIGISNAEQAAAAVALGADGVIIGSACLLEAEQGEQRLRSFLTEVRGALDNLGS